MALFDQLGSQRFLCLALGCASGSAGGMPKAQLGSESTTLAMAEDIRDFKDFLSQDSRKFRYYGEHVVSHDFGSVVDVRSLLQRFFNACRAEDRAPLVYYTGHGDFGSGDWAFPDGRISFDDLRSYNQTRWAVHALCDCCFSGRWVEQSASHADMKVWAAAGPDHVATNRCFATAMFDDDFAETTPRHALLGQGACRTGFGGAGESAHLVPLVA